MLEFTLLYLLHDNDKNSAACYVIMQKKSFMSTLFSLLN